MELTTKDTFVDCLSQQLAEYELLKSMYPDPIDIVLTDKNIVKEINTFLEHKSEHIPNHLDFKLNLLISGFKLEVFINLPSLYPKEEPDIYVRCNQMNRTNESKLNSELFEYIKDNHIGEVCLYTAISWLQDNIHQFSVATQQLHIVDDIVPDCKVETFARFWVYSHHIYNKRKREDILRRAKELKLTGFSLPGKPGVICVEGHYSDCDDWWRDIKAMTWQKIALRKTETFSLSEEKTYKKFSNFEELNLSMKDLAKYMNELGLNNDFNDFFGLCNDS